MSRLKRACCYVCLAAGLLCLAATQAPAAAQESAADTAAADNLGPYKLINTAIFAALLIWAIWKYAPGFFNARSADIQKAIQDATGLKMDADFRYSDADKRMANLGKEVERLKAENAASLEREHNQLLAQTEEELRKIAAGKQNEIEALRAEAAAKVRTHAAGLALGLAERRLKDQLSSDDFAKEQNLDDFLHLVGRG